MKKALKILSCIMLIGIFTVVLFGQSADATKEQNMKVTSTKLTDLNGKRAKKQKSIDQSDINRQAWELIANSPQCATNSSTTVSDACAQLAIIEVGLECSVASRYFKRESQLWKWTSFSLTMASAAFTGIGASTTIASAKVWSTLGGTTGLGAATASANANVTSDQVGIASVNTTLTNFTTYIQTGKNGNPPAAADIFKIAPLYGAQCMAAATSSAGNSAK